MVKAPFRMIGANFGASSLYMYYAGVANSVSHQLIKLIIANQVIEINKKYHLK